MEKKSLNFIEKLINWDFVFETICKNTPEFKFYQEILLNYSILPPGLPKSSKIFENCLEYTKSKYKDNIFINKSIGSLMGLAIGDSLGHLTEFSELNYDRNVIKDFIQKYYEIKDEKDGILNLGKLKAGQWTDDTSQMLCLVDSLIENHEFNAIDFKKRLILWWHFGYNNGFRYDLMRENQCSIGRGSSTKACMQEFVENKGKIEITNIGDPLKSNSNGSLMRLAPIPIFYHDNFEKAIEFAEKSSFCTHKGIEASDCCKLVTFYIIEAIESKEKYKNAKVFFDKIDTMKILPFLKSETVKSIAKSEQEKNFIKDQLNEKDLDRNWNWKNKDFKYSETRSLYMPGTIGAYVCDGLAMALHCLYFSKNLSECLLRIANLGGDADTVGAIAGQIGGAIYGITEFPKEWIKNVFKWDRGEIALKAIMLYEKKSVMDIVLENNYKIE